MKVGKYKCKDCEAEFELLEGNTPEVKCISCESKNVKKEGTKEIESGCGGGCSACHGCE